MPSTASAAPSPTHGVFGLFCLGSYLLSVSYGTTFLLAMVLSAHGGSESDAGTIISLAMLSTFGAVIFSGHLTDLFGAPKAIAAGAALRCNSMEQAVQQALALLSTAPAETGASDSTRAAMQRAALVFSQAHRGAAQRMTSDLHQRGWLG